MAATKSRPWGNVKPPAGSTVNWGDPISQGLVSLMLLNEKGPLRSYDIASPRNGVCTNGATSTVGPFGHAVTFDGVDDYILMSAGMPSTVTNTGPKTISVIVNIRSSAGNGQRIVYHSIGGVQFALWIPANPVTFGCYVDGASAIGTSLTFSLNTTYHVVATWNGTITVLYVNAVSQATAASATSFSPLNFTLGGRSDITRSIDGTLNCVRIYSRALSKNEVMRLYTEPFAGITEPRIKIRSGATAPFYPAYNIFTGESAGSLIGAS